MTQSVARTPDAPGGARPHDARPARPASARRSTPSVTSANEAWEALLTAHATLMRGFAAGDLWREVSMREYDVLYTLTKCPAPVRQSELERHVLLSQPAISRLVDRLVGRGLVAKETDPDDGRAVRLALTTAGRAVQRRVGARHARDVARAVGGRLTSAELEELRRLTTLLADGGTQEDSGT